MISTATISRSCARRCRPGLDAMRGVLTRAHEAKIASLRDELAQARLQVEEAQAQIAKLTVELGDAGAALETEKQSAEVLRRAIDGLRMTQQRLGTSSTPKSPN